MLHGVRSGMITDGFSSIVARASLGSLSNDDDDDNDNAAKQ